MPALQCQAPVPTGSLHKETESALNASPTPLMVMIPAAEEAIGPPSVGSEHLA